VQSRIKGPLDKIGKIRVAKKEEKRVVVKFEFRVPPRIPANQRPSLRICTRGYVPVGCDFIEDSISHSAAETSGVMGRTGAGRSIAAL